MQIAFRYLYKEGTHHKRSGIVGQRLGVGIGAVTFLAIAGFID
jgi:hypothetical protein